MKLKVSGKRLKPKPKSQVIGMPPHLSDALDALIALQPDPKPSRPEMIRRVLAKRLADEGLGVVEPDRSRKAG